MTPEEIVEKRSALGWTRKRFADELGVTTHVAWRFEHQGARDETELANIRRVLESDGSTDTDAEGYEDPDAEWTGETVDTDQWRGLKKGDVCKVYDKELEKGKPARFVRYFRSETQEYVEVYSERGGTRCVTPNRIRDAAGRRLQGDD